MVARDRVHLQGVDREVLEFGERLKPGVAAADEHKAQQLVKSPPVGHGLGQLERTDHVVAQPDRVGEALELGAVFGQSGDRQRA